MADSVGDTEGIGVGVIVFTLWYLGIAYNYYTGYLPLKEGCSEDCGDDDDVRPPPAPAQVAPLVLPPPAPAQVAPLALPPPPPQPPSPPAEPDPESEPEPPADADGAGDGEDV